MSDASGVSVVGFNHRQLLDSGHGFWTAHTRLLSTDVLKSDKTLRGSAADDMTARETSPSDLKEVLTIVTLATSCI